MSDATSRGPDSGLRLEALYRSFYGTLRAIAVRVHRSDPHGTLRPTDILHEAYLKLSRNAQPRWTSRTHFIQYAACAMKHVLVNYARARDADKRYGKHERVSIDACLAAEQEFLVPLLDLHENLKILEATHPRAAQVVRLRIFKGRTAQEAADELGISKRTADSDYDYALRFLRLRLGGPAD